jgi:hypothetical protein
MRELVQAAPEDAAYYLTMLSPVDQEIGRLYYFDKLSQSDIGRVLDINQAAVSRRLKNIGSKLRFFLSRPMQNPVQVAEDFEEIFPPELVEVAHLFYFEIHCSRVRYFLRTSATDAANQFKRVLAYLEKLVALPERGSHNPAVLKGMGMVGPDGCVLADDEVAYKRYLAQGYLEYFRYAKKYGPTMDRAFRKNDDLRKGSLKHGPSII